VEPLPRDGIPQRQIDERDTLKFRNIAVVSLAATISAIALGAGGAQAAQLWDSSNIKDHSLLARDFSPKAKTALKGASGPTGATGSQGVPGQQGIPGTPGTPGHIGEQGAPGIDGEDGEDGEDGMTGLVTRSYNYIKDASYPGAGSGGIATVACDDDPAVSQTKVAIGGGVQFLDVGRNAGTIQSPYVGETHITDSFPGRMDWNNNTPKPNRLDGWIVRLNDTPSVDMRVWVTCVDAPPAA